MTDIQPEVDPKLALASTLAAAAPTAEPVKDPEPGIASASEVPPKAADAAVGGLEARVAALEKAISQLAFQAEMSGWPAEFAAFARKLESYF